MSWLRLNRPKLLHSLSQHIRMLGDSLQVKLFVRLGNRVALTEEGHALKPRIGEAVAIMA